ncbi:MAG: 30S ribosome-binding factor RbfA [Myxococcales bacterium]|nr:30S ribosome-binding factor RbfA [Polyangiaceae bacterium]MDW8249652.1 30S ribosome-binding factor RbfA [Myxococcales bacterium]
MAESHRTARIAERLRAELARLLREEISDPRLVDVYISRTEVTGDLQRATVGVRLSPRPGRDAQDDAIARQRALAGLRSASGRLRSLVAQHLGLRRALQLSFVFDDGFDAQERIEKLLHEIAQEKKSEGSG